MKNKIVIIGAGQLGSRHLQSLADLNGQDYEVFVYDTMQESLDTAKERYDGCIIKNSPTVSYSTNFKSLPQDIKVGIVATGSLVRRSVVESLLEHADVEYLILEKFLFPRIEDYDAIAQLLKEKEVHAFVNTPRRTFDFYRQIKQSITYPFHMDLTGIDWGIGCNSVHFLDLFMYLNGGAKFEVINNLDDEILESKRQGYIEFTGSLIFKDELGNTLILSSFKEGDRASVLSIADKNKKSNIHEGGLSKIYSYEKEGSQLMYVETDISIPYQSKMTSKIVEEVVDTGRSSLTSFEESSFQHMKLLELFLQHYNTITQKQTDLCLIT